jgi:putative membrane protein
MAKYLLTAAAAALLTTFAGNAGAIAAAPPSGGSADMMPKDRANYMRMASSSDLYEIQSSQLAVQRSQSPAVRKFAQMMIEHHTMTSQQMMTAAKAAGANPPPPQLMPMHAEMIAQLQGANGTGFDQLYMNQQVQAHKMGLQLHRTYANDGDTAALQSTARTVVPIVERHLAAAQQLQR